MSILIGFILVIGVFFYFNFDYLAFKIFITSSYIYTETLDDLYKKYLDIDTKGKYYNDFDNFVIAATTERIRAERGDMYTYLYTPTSLQRSRQLDKKQSSRRSESWMTALYTSDSPITPSIRSNSWRKIRRTSKAGRISS